MYANGRFGGSIPIVIKCHLKKQNITMKRGKLEAKSEYVIDYSYLLSINDGVDTDVAKYSFLVTIPTIILPLLSMKIS